MGSLNHLRVEVQRLDRGSAEPFENDPHTDPTSAAHFERPPALDPTAQAFHPGGSIVLAQGTGRVVHRCPAQPVESHGASPLRVNMALIMQTATGHDGGNGARKARLHRLVV